MQVGRGGRHGPRARSGGPHADMAVRRGRIQRRDGERHGDGLGVLLLFYFFILLTEAVALKKLPRLKD